MIRRLLHIPTKHTLPLLKSTLTASCSWNLPSNNLSITYLPTYSFARNPKKSEHTAQATPQEQEEGSVVIEDEEEFDDETTGTSHHEEAVSVEPVSIQKSGDKVLLKTMYGMVEVKGSLLSSKKIEALENIYYVNDRVSINYLRKVLKSDPNGLIVFDPTSHYVNMIGLYNGYKKKLYAQFYGTSKKPRNPFKNCKNNAEIYNLNRRIKMQISNSLTRILFIVDYEANLRVKGQNLTISETLKGIITPGLAQEVEQTKIGFYRHNFLIPVSFWQGIHTSDEWEKSGIIVEALLGKKVYPLYSVWSPTSQTYLSLLENYLEEKRNMVKSRKNVLDLGCGTGVLSYMFVQKTGLKDVYAVDKNKRAVECTLLNTQLLDMTDSIKVGNLDVVDTVKANLTEKKLKDLKFPVKYEMMIANPPWITSSILNSEHLLDSGVYDPKETFLKAIFQFAANHLSVQSSISKNGILLLYYSDLSQILGIQSKDRIEELCKEHKMTITNVYKTKFIEDQNAARADKDPIANFKNQAKVLLYEITRL